jgi:putative transposase
MKKKSKFTEAEIIHFLRQAEQGLTVAELCRRGGFSDTSFYNWRARYGIPPARDSRSRLHALEGENAELKKLLAEAHLHIRALKRQVEIKA